MGATRSQTEALLEDWEERYHELEELCPDLLVTVVDGKIVSINRAGIELLGATEASQVLGRSLSDLILPIYRSRATEHLQRIAQGDRPALTEEKWLKLDGTAIDVEVTAISFITHGRPAIQLIAREITRRKQAEAALRESEDRHHRLMELYLDLIGVETARTAELHAALRRAREVDGLKSQLLSMVSHEMRTPLTAIRGQTSTLLDYADQMNDDEKTEALHIVDKEAARLDELISHLLDMSRIESGTLRVEPVATDLRPILQETIALIATQAPTHKLSANLPPDLLLAQADPRRVRQVISNLLDNAVKFSPQGTTITVNATANGTAVQVSVRDEGPGIASDHLPHIFERFYQAEVAGVRTSGVGLGLAICKGLIEAMGGHITVNSQVGQGSTFSFSLPATPGVSEHGKE